MTSRRLRRTLPSGLAHDRIPTARASPRGCHARPAGRVTVCVRTTTLRPSSPTSPAEEFVAAPGHGAVGVFQAPQPVRPRSAAVDTTLDIDSPFLDLFGGTGGRHGDGRSYAAAAAARTAVRGLRLRIRVPRPDRSAADPAAQAPAPATGLADTQRRSGLAPTPTGDRPRGHRTRLRSAARPRPSHAPAAWRRRARTAERGTRRPTEPSRSDLRECRRSPGRRSDPQADFFGEPGAPFVEDPAEAGPTRGMPVAGVRPTTPSRRAVRPPRRRHRQLPAAPTRDDEPVPGGHRRSRRRPEPYLAPAPTEPDAALPVPAPEKAPARRKEKAPGPAQAGRRAQEPPGPRAASRDVKPAPLRPHKLKFNDRDPAMELAISEIAGHLTFTQNTVTAWYWLPEVRWAFRPDAEREALLAAISEQYAGLAGFRLHLRRTNRPFPADEWARTVDSHTAKPLPDVPGATSWSDHLVAAQRHLLSVNHAEGQTYLGVTFARRSLGDTFAERILRIFGRGTADGERRKLGRTVEQFDEVLDAFGMRGRRVTAAGAGVAALPLGGAVHGAARHALAGHQRALGDRRPARPHRAGRALPHPVRLDGQAGQPDDRRGAARRRARRSAGWSRWRSPRSTSRGCTSTSGCRGRWSSPRGSTSSAPSDSFRNLEHRLRMIRSQQLDYAEHGIDAPPELERLAKRALVIGDEMTTGLPVDSARAHGWHRIAVGGAHPRGVPGAGPPAHPALLPRAADLPAAPEEPGLAGPRVHPRRADRQHRLRPPDAGQAARRRAAAGRVDRRRPARRPDRAYRRHLPPAGLPRPALPDGGTRALRARRLRRRARRWQVDPARRAGLPGRPPRRAGDPARPVRPAGPAVPDARAAAVLPGAQPDRLRAGHARAVRADPDADPRSEFADRRRPATGSSRSPSPTPAPSGACWSRTSA